MFSKVFYEGKIKICHFEISLVEAYLHVVATLTFVDLLCSINRINPLSLIIPDCDGTVKVSNTLTERDNLLHVISPNQPA